MEEEFERSLWDRTAVKPETFPVPEWHGKILKERLRKLQANPEQGREWEEVRDKIMLKIQTLPKS